MATDLRGRRVTVAGLGKFGGGIGVARWLVAQGADVLVTDRAPAETLASSIAQLDGLPVRYRLGEERVDDFLQTDLLVASPAIPPAHAGLAKAYEQGVAVTTEIALFAERCPARVVGITGTKGKSTTAKLVELMLASRHTVHLGGNIGASLLERLGMIRPTDWVVLELSSFMLHHLGRMRWSPHVAVLTMIGRDHLDWHGTIEAYHDAKAQIVKHQRPGDVVVVDPTQETSARVARQGVGCVLEIDEQDDARIDLKLPGRHNRRHAMLALRVAEWAGVAREQACDAVKAFGGLPHRLEVVHDAGGVRWVNDSIATIPEAAITACKAFEWGRVIQIVGGRDKGNDMRAMCEALARRCKLVLTIGECGSALAAMGARANPRAAWEACGSLEVAVARAREAAASGDVVLLSTGCASYDQFANFAARGERFATLARGI